MEPFLHKHASAIKHMAIHLNILTGSCEMADVFYTSCTVPCVQKCSYPFTLMACMGRMCIFLCSCSLHSNPSARLWCYQSSGSISSFYI